MKIIKAFAVVDKDGNLHRDVDVLEIYPTKKIAKDYIREDTPKIISVEIHMPA